MGRKTVVNTASSTVDSPPVVGSNASNGKHAHILQCCDPVVSDKIDSCLSFRSETVSTKILLFSRRENDNRFLNEKNTEKSPVTMRHNPQLLIIE